MIKQKVEIRFEKSEAVRYISHHDVMRAFQRAVRRAQIPVRLTQGFNPRPRIVFPVALEVGIASLDEAAELELTQCIPLNQLKESLAAHLPPGLNLKNIRNLEPTRKGQVPARILYRLHLGQTPFQVTEAQLEVFLEAPELPYPRPVPPGKRHKMKRRAAATRTVDLKTSLASVVVVDDGDLEVEVAPAAKGGIAKPLEILSLLLKCPKADLLEVRVTKLQMALEMPRPGVPEAEATDQDDLPE